MATRDKLAGRQVRAMIEVWYDGACEPRNPGGTASYGLVIKKDGQTVFEESKIVGIGSKMSNNVAEYSGAIRAMEWLLATGYKKERIHVRGDNKMSINQMARVWKVATWDGLYVPYWRKAMELVTKFKHIHFEWIPREQNGEADDISKRALREAGVKFRIQPE